MNERSFIFFRKIKNNESNLNETSKGLGFEKIN